MRWKGIIAALLIVVAGFVFTTLFMDSFVRNRIESIGSDLVGAKVSLDSIDISIKRQSITISGLQVADPKNPWTNIIQLKSMNFDFSLADLLMGNLIIEDLSVDRPLFGKKRKTSGALTKKRKKAAGNSSESVNEKSIIGDVVEKVRGRVGEIADEKTGGMIGELNKDVEWGRYLPSTDDIENFDAAALVNPDTMSSIRELEETAKFVEGRDVYWRDKYEELDREYNELKAIFMVVTLEKVIKHHKRLNAFVKKVGARKKELQADLNRLESARKNIEKLKNQDLENALNIRGLASGDLSEISRGLFENVYRDKLGKLLERLEIYKSALAGMQSSEGDDKKRMKGVTVHYPVRKPMPRFYLKKASFNIDDGAKKENWFSGLLKDVSSDPSLTGKATTFEMTGGVEGYPGALFLVKGKAEYIGREALYSLNITGDHISSNLAQNSLGVASPIAITGGRVKFESQFSMEGDRIRSEFFVNLTNIEMSARREGLKSVDEKIVKVLNDSVRDVSNVSVMGKATGTVNDLKISISSDLDKILANVFTDMVEAAKKEIKVRIRAELNKEIGKRLPELQAMLKDDSDNIKSIENVLAELKGRIDEKKKREEDELKAKVKKEQKKAERKLKKEINKKIKNLFKF